MRQLSLVGISEDGSRLVLTAGPPPAGTDPAGPHPSGADGAGADGAGADGAAVGGAAVGGEPAGEFSVALDDRLRAATRGDRARLGQLQIRFESSLRPRDIQARIRGGETPEQVARAAGIPMDKVLRFATPVLAEREHMVTEARRHPLHRRSEPGGTSLDDAVTARLTDHGVDPAVVAWDAHRRDDGAWVVTAGYPGGTRPRTATFRFDPAARRTVAQDDDAHWIAGEAAGPTSGGGRPRLSTVDPAGTARQLSAADAFDAAVADELAAAAAPRGPEGFGRDGAPEPDAARPPGTAATPGTAPGIAAAPGTGGVPDEETIDVPFAGSWPEMPGWPARAGTGRDAGTEAGLGDQDGANRPRPPRTRAFARRERTPDRPVEVPAAAGSVPAALVTLTPFPRRPEDPPAAADPGRREPAAADDRPGEGTHDSPPADEKASRHTGAGNRRQAVPSWDEIMFGRRSD